VLNVSEISPYQFFKVKLLTYIPIILEVQLLSSEGEDSMYELLTMCIWSDNHPCVAIYDLLPKYLSIYMCAQKNANINLSNTYYSKNERHFNFNFCE
jgi:hypothetical protein